MVGIHNVYPNRFINILFINLDVDPVNLNKLFPASVLYEGHRYGRNKPPARLSGNPASFVCHHRCVAFRGGAHSEKCPGKMIVKDIPGMYNDDSACTCVISADHTGGSIRSISVPLIIEMPLDVFTEQADLADQYATQFINESAVRIARIVNQELLTKYSGRQLICRTQEQLA
jgi:hypothetical protein